MEGSVSASRPGSPKSDSRVMPASAELPLEPAAPVSPLGPPVMPPASTDAPRPLAPPPSRLPEVDPSDAPLPTLEQQLAAQPALVEKCSLPGDLKSIGAVTADLSFNPEDLSGNKRLPPECSLGDTPLHPRQWRRVTFAWTAASTCHNPIYFDDEQLERYGHCWGPVRQGVVSAVEFYAMVPLVPYFMGVYPPNECIYDLGQYRPGDCAALTTSIPCRSAFEGRSMKEYSPGACSQHCRVLRPALKTRVLERAE